MHIILKEFRKCNLTRHQVVPYTVYSAMLSLSCKEGKKQPSWVCVILQEFVQQTGSVQN
jgi:hypothetical protein